MEKIISGRKTKANMRGDKLREQTQTASEEKMVHASIRIEIYDYQNAGNVFFYYLKSGAGRSQIAWNEQNVF